MPYSVYVSDEALEYINSLDDKSRSICCKNISKLNEPYPGRGSGDKEKIVVEGEKIYRLHIGRSHTAFYIIDEESKAVRVIEVLTIKDAHKKYGY